MKRRVYQGVSGIIIVTMVTSFMLMYNSSSGDRSSSLSPSSSSSASRHLDPIGAATKMPEGQQRRHTPSTLQGYPGVMDRKSLQMYCRTCSLVTSSGQLTGSGRGEEIDRSECVLRMNNAPTRGHWRDVGRRTSLRVVAHSSLQKVVRDRQELLNASADTIFIFWGPRSSMRRDGKGHVYNTLRMINQLLPQLRIHVISHSKMLKFDELFTKETGIDRRNSNSWLSTGWFTMAIALELCDRVNVFGMVPPNFCRSASHPSVPYHYYEPQGPDECSMYLSHLHHRFITEKTVFADWARTRNIHFYQPHWKPNPAVVMANGTAAGS